MEVRNEFTEGAKAAHSLAHTWLIDAAKAARMAEEAEASGDLVMSKRYAEQSERYSREAEKSAERAAWYEMQASYCVRHMEAAE